jgi:predicted DNA-binding transcriptional regulator AlpA
MTALSLELNQALAQIERALATQSAPQPLMTMRDVCQYLVIDRKTLYTLRCGGSFPLPIKLASSEKSLRWKFEEVMAWAESQRATY